MRGLKRKELANLRWTAVALGDGAPRVLNVVEKHYTGDLSEVHRQAMRRIAGTA